MTLRLPWQGAEVPCAVLDIIRGCNARCAHCLAQDAPSVKTVAEVGNDLEALMGSRKLQSIMISGGEPTLHPGLPEIVQLCAAKRLKVILLTNGVLLDDGLAAGLKEAGCFLCFLHIQTSQTRPDIRDPSDVSEVAALRRRKGEILGRAGIRAGLCETLCAADKEAAGRALDHYFADGLFSHLLVTTARSPKDFDNPGGMDDVAIGELVSRFRQQGLVPFATLPGKINTRQPRWFSFHVVEAARRDGSARGRVSLKASWGERAVMRLRRMWLGHHEFVMPEHSGAMLRARLLLNAATGFSWGSLALAFGAWRGGEKLRFRNVALETPPYRMRDGRIEHCADCPGATWKKGELKPLCLVDVKM